MTETAALSMQDFIEKMDCEGGLVEMIHWGGVECFPLELQVHAEAIKTAVAAIEAAIEAHESGESDS